MGVGVEVELFVEKVVVGFVGFDHPSLPFVMGRLHSKAPPKRGVELVMMFSPTIHGATLMIQFSKVW